MNQELKAEGLEDVRFCASLHDELHYMCLEHDAFKVATCLVRAHVGVWALLSSRLGIPDLPVSRLVYDIEIDCGKLLKKDAFEVIDTPDMSGGIYAERGYKYRVSRDSGRLEKIEYTGK